MSIYRLLLLLPLLLCSFVVSDAGTNAPAAEPVSEAEVRPGPGQHYTTVTPEDFWWQFSTNRIMERIPDIGLLRGRAGNPDVWFWLSLGLFAACFVLNFISDESDEYITDWIFWSVLGCFVAGSVSQALYILSSEEPLSFFSPDIHSVWRCAAVLVAMIIVVQAQFNLLVKLLNSIEYRTRKGFKSSWTSFFVWGTVVSLLGYFVTRVFNDKPEWWWWAGTAVLYAVPPVLMLLSSCIARDVRPLLIGVPLYVVGTLPLIFVVSVVSVVVLTIIIVCLIVRLAMFILGEGTLEYDKSGGRYLYVFPDGSKSLFDRHVW